MIGECHANLVKPIGCTLHLYTVLRKPVCPPFTGFWWNGQHVFLHHACTAATRLAVGVRPREKRKYAAGPARVIAVEQMVRARVFLIDSALDEPHAEHALIKREVLLRMFGNGSEVVEPERIHAAIVTRGSTDGRFGWYPGEVLRATKERNSIICGAQKRGAPCAKNTQQRLTVVELLIVVAIIGILAAILTPQFLNARKNAAEKAARASVHNVYTAMQAYIAETGNIDFFDHQKSFGVFLLTRQITTIMFQNLALVVASP